MSARPLAALALLLLALPASAAVTGHSIVSNCGGEAGNFVTITFTSDEPVTLVDVRWDFTGSLVWYDPTGVSFCGTINDGLDSATLYLDPPGGRAQVFGLQCTGFDGGDAYQHACDLDRGSGGTPFTDDFLGGTVTCEFSDGRVLTGTFDTPFDEPNGARADLAAAGPNLLFQDREGWCAPVAPRPDDDATWTSVPMPGTLHGDQEATWLSACCYNAGTSQAGPTSMVVQLDGQTICTHNLWVIDPGHYNGWTSDGPHTVRGGRHALVGVCDAGGTVEETDETDNVFARQWIWTPATLPQGDQVTRAAPPPQEAAFEHLSGQVYYNCDGLRVTPDGDHPWNVVWMLPLLGPPPDYWLRLYPAATGPSAGFGASYANTGASTGLDALVINRHQMTAGAYDVGVLNAEDGPVSSGYRIQHLGSSPYPFGFGIFPQTPYFVSRVMSFDLPVGGGDLGPASLVAVTDPDDGPISLGWLPPDFTCGPLGAVQGVRQTGAGGWAVVNLDLTQTGHHGVVCWGEPGEHPGGLAVRVGSFRARAELYPATLTGWFAPVVPRPDPDAVLFSCGEPDTLHGGSAATYLNTAGMNGGSAAADTVSFALAVDGLTRVGYRNVATPLPAGHPRTLLNLTEPGGGEPWTIRGGRHTLTVEMDYLDEQTELLETENNRAGRQYCWSPAALAVGGVVACADLPAREGGHDACSPGAELHPNCLGLRMQAADLGSDGRWRAVAAMSGAAAQNVDVVLHAPLVGATGGFGPSPLAASTFPPGQVDFVLVHAAAAGALPCDVALLDAGPAAVGGADATVQDAVSALVGTPAIGPLGPFTLPGGEMLHLYELQLPAGPLMVRLDDLGAGLAWGLSLYRGDAVYRDKLATVAGGYAESAGPADPAAFAVEVPAAGSYALAVWKARSAGLPLAAPYRLWLTPGATGIGGAGGAGAAGSPAVTRLVGVSPNPCNPTTVIRFELAADAPCRLVIHDARGRRVRELVHRALRAGRHEVVFDGRDDAGRVLPSGVYLARLEAGGVRELGKVVIVR